MDSSRLEGYGDLRVVGCRCSLFNDPEKSQEINSGKLLVPWANNSDLTIDRWVCWSRSVPLRFRNTFS